MKRIFCAAAVFFLVFLFTFCQKNDEDCLSYQKKAFEGVFEVSRDGMVFTASVKGGKWSSERGISRDACVEFTAPMTLSGIKLTRASGKTVISLGDISFEGDGETYSYMAEFLSLFELTAVPASFDIEDENTRAIFSGKNGEEIVLLLGKDGLPKEISDGRTSIKVISYNINE